MIRWLKDILEGLASLATGMGVTLRVFARPAVTQQYPEQRAIMHARFRGRVDMPLDPATGAHKCTLCMLCVKACPNGSLEIVAGVNEAGKRVLDKYIYKLSTCTLCELCVEACNFDAIRMSQDYEMATYDRQQLTMVLNEPYGKVFAKIPPPAPPSPLGEGGPSALPVPAPEPTA